MRLKVTPTKKLFLLKYTLNVQLIIFFNQQKNFILCSRYLDFCVFQESMNFKICDVIIDITTY